MIRCDRWISVFLVLAVCGCQTRGSVETLESQLRAREQALDDVRLQLADVRRDLKVAKQEADALRQQVAKTGRSPIATEQADRIYRAEQIQFHRTFTLAVDEQGNAGAEALMAVLQPVDGDGELVRLPGKIELELLDFSLPKGQQRIGFWEFDEEASLEKWHKGFLTAGYLFKLPWQTVPSSNTLTLHARLKTNDGRQFDTTTEVRVTGDAVASRGRRAGEPALGSRDRSTGVTDVARERTPIRDVSRSRIKTVPLPAESEPDSESDADAESVPEPKAALSRTDAPGKPDGRAPDGRPIVSERRLATERTVGTVPTITPGTGSAAGSGADFDGDHPVRRVSPVTDRTTSRLTSSEPAPADDELVPDPIDLAPLGRPTDPFSTPRPPTIPGVRSPKNSDGATAPAGSPATPKPNTPAADVPGPPTAAPPRGTRVGPYRTSDNWTEATIPTLR